VAVVVVTPPAAAAPGMLPHAQCVMFPLNLVQYLVLPHNMLLSTPFLALLYTSIGLFVEVIWSRMNERRLMLPILRVPEGKQQYMEQQQNMMIQEQVDIHESTTAS
jgi:hypothetical protein